MSLGDPPATGLGAVDRRRQRDPVVRAENALVGRHHASAFVTGRADRETGGAGTAAAAESDSGHEEESAERRTYRLSWCVLLGRVFQVDVTVCPDCGAMKIIAALTEATSIRNYLLGVGLPCRAPPVAAARPDPQPQFEQA